MRFDIVTISPQNENGKTNLPLGLCQETEADLTAIQERYSYPIDVSSRARYGMLTDRLTPACFIRLRPLIEAKVRVSLRTP